MTKLSIEIVPNRYNFSSLKVDFPWSREEIIAEMEKENWHPYGVETAVKHDAWTGKRFKCHRPASPILQKISGFFAKDSTRDYLIECLYRDKPILQINWQMYPWRMSQNTELHAEFTKDMPGFENGVHCDMRRLVATGMIYLTDGDNPDLSSAFYDHPNRENPCRVPTGFGVGWVHSNDWNTWHDGWNRTNETRYSILLALTLKLQHEPQATDQEIQTTV
jgi:hypothetical protein